MDDFGRRRNRRFDVADIEGSFVVRIDVKVTNLSVGGMAIETRSTLIVGRDYLFRIRHHRRDVDVMGRVMWCVLGRTLGADDEVKPVFRAGIQFEDILDDQVLELQKLIEGSAEFDTGDPVTGRFVAAFGASIGIDEQTQFEITKISLSGMLVDTDRAPRKDEVLPFEAQLGDRIFTSHGRVAYIEPYLDDRGYERYRLGVEFTLLSDRARSTLCDFLAKLIASSEHEASA